MASRNARQLPQLGPDTGKTKKAYLWAYRSNDLEPGPILVFDYQPSRHGVHARNFLDGWQVHLMVDDYTGYKALFMQGVTERVCLARARRKFFALCGQPKPDRYRGAGPERCWETGGRQYTWLI